MTSQILWENHKHTHTHPPLSSTFSKHAAAAAAALRAKTAPRPYLMHLSAESQIYGLGKRNTQIPFPIVVLHTPTHTRTLLLLPTMHFLMLMLLHKAPPFVRSLVVVVHLICPCKCLFSLWEDIRRSSGGGGALWAANLNSHLLPICQQHALTTLKRVVVHCYAYTTLTNCVFILTRQRLGQEDCHKLFLNGCCIFSLLADEPDSGIGICGLLLTGVSWIVVIVTLPFSLCVCFKVHHDQN